jgi:peptidoglycan/xylan/chitin deacetylase (PgdA/CDA1 family)
VLLICTVPHYAYAATNTSESLPSLSYWKSGDISDGYQQNTKSGQDEFYVLYPWLKEPLSLPVTNTFKRALVSITFDDSYSSQYTHAYPILTTYDMHATFYIISNSVDTHSNSMTSDQLKTLYQNGNEIASHTVTHPHMNSLSVTKIDDELTNSQSFLENLLETPVLNFATPYGEYNAKVLTEIPKYYSSHRTSDFGYNTKSNFNPNSLLVQYSFGSTNPDQIQSYVNHAIADKSWLILVYHKIDNSGGEYSTTPSTFATEMANLKKSGVAVLTVQQALSEIKAQSGD